MGAAVGAPVLAWPPQQLHRAAREFDLTPPQAQRAEGLALRIRNGAAAWAWNPALVDWHGNEVELVQQGVPLRLDRLVRLREGGLWWVLDYKSHGQPQRQAGGGGNGVALRQLRVIPHVAQNLTRQTSAIDGRTTATRAIASASRSGSGSKRSSGG